MSIVRAVCRLALVEALKGQTLFGTNVRDSLASSIEFDANGIALTIPEQDKPFLAIYSDGSIAEKPELHPAGMHSGGRTMFVFEFGIAEIMFETVSDESGERPIPVLGLPATDANMELTLDLGARQIMDGITDPDNVWSQIFMGLVHPFNKLERSRIGNAEDTLHLAGQQIRLTGTVADDPAKGEPIADESPLSAFFTLAENSGDADLITKAAKLKAAIDGEYDELAIIQRRTGMTNYDADALGSGLQDGADDDSSFNTVDIETGGTGTVSVAGE